MGYSKRKISQRTRRKSPAVIILACLLLFAIVVSAAYMLLVSKNDQHIKRESSEIKSAKRQSVRHDEKRGTLDYSRARNEKASTEIKAEYNALVDLPLLDIKKWCTVYDYGNKVTQVKKNKIFYELVNGACPAIDLTSKIRGLANFRATATTSFYWVPFPDGIPCIVREVKEYDDFIQLELNVKDEANVKVVKNYYMDDSDAYIVGVMNAFDDSYFSLAISMANPCYAAMCDLNIDDVVTSKNWGNLFVINTARRGDRTPLRAGGMKEKSDLFDVKFAILKAVQFESVAH